MQYSVNVEGFDNQPVSVESAGWVSAGKILQNGQPAPKGKKRGEFLITRDDGQQAVAKLGTNYIDPIPTITIDGKKIHVAEPLKWYQWIWAAWPLILVFLGGAIGGGLGALATAVNARIFRAEFSTISQYILIAVISGLTFVLYLALALLIQMLAG